jgi:hypothetical protein
MRIIKLYACEQQRVNGSHNGGRKRAFGTCRTLNDHTPWAPSFCKLENPRVAPDRQPTTQSSDQVSSEGDRILFIQYDGDGGWGMKEVVRKMEGDL